jgi:CO/xanthine dehydrogenase Mo-binding subunit
LSPYVLLYAVVAAPGPYRVDNLSVDAQAVATNNMFTSAFRGFGGAQACIAYEQQMDEVAGALGMDRIEFRRKNYLKTGDSLSTGHPIRSAVWTEDCVDKAMAALGEPSPAPHPAVRIGRGVAAYQQSYGRITWLHDTSEGWVGVEVDGAVIVRSGVTDIGAGQVSALGQIAAELLGVGLGDVTIYSSDSAVTPLAGTTTATRALYMTGNAIRLAATAVRERLIERAAKALGVAAGEVDLGDSKAFVIGRPDKSMDFVDLVRLCAAEGIHRSELAMFRAPFTEPVDPETGQGQVHPDYTYGAHAIEVAVDIETGEVAVLKSIGAHDIGQAINPAAVEGQIEGGAAQGQGYALSEEMIYQEGRLTTPSFSEYLIPTAMDMPKVRSIILESRSGVGPFGAKGIGEPSITPVAPAIANAVADAIGARVFDLPITPEKVVAALRSSGNEGE